jgi:gamma-glutamyl hercynylcysteine S-oxide synthase
MARTVPPHTVAPDPLAAETLAALDGVRRDTLALVAHLSDEALERVHSPLQSPLAWDLAHIAAYEDLWLAHRHAGLELLRPDLAERYDAFETPRAVRGSVELLDAPAARAYLEAVRERVALALAHDGVGDGVLTELVLRHELQHTETMRQTLALAGLLPPGEPRLAPLGDAEEWLELPAGAFSMGAGPDGFAYDNERPRHLAQTGAFRIARRPVTNASWLRFAEGGGYERREWWSAEGWAWKEEYDLTHHAAVAAGHPQAPVCHVSWFEADAFARAHGARLPTEAEWERAARRTQPGLAGVGLRGAGGRANRGAEPEAAGPAGGALEGVEAEAEAEAAGPTGGALEGVGQVWEWTASPFRGYPGFVAYPYREYSEVFFGDRYRVLRGGSWATSPRVAGPTFRNWDLPVRRQIFAGLRLARDWEG